MEMNKEHRTLLLAMGLTEEDLRLMDGVQVSYEFDEKLGVRLFDPDSMTSYGEYIDIEGWSAWSSEDDTFIRPALDRAWKSFGEREKVPMSEDEFARKMGAKFGSGQDSEEEDTGS